MNHLHLTYIQRYGFIVNKRLYIWQKKSLYIFTEKYPLKQQVVNGTYGYYIDRKFHSMKRLKEMTKEVDAKMVLN